MPPKLGQIPSDNLINNTCKANKSRIKTDAMQICIKRTYLAFRSKRMVKTSRLL